MKILEDINDRIDGIVKWIIIIAMIIIPGVMTLQVIIRYVFNYPLSWAEESVRYTFIWLVFMSACAALRRGELIATDFLITRLPPRLAYVLTLVSRVCDPSLPGRGGLLRLRYDDFRPETGNPVRGHAGADLDRLLRNAGRMHAHGIPDHPQPDPSDPRHHPAARGRRRIHAHD